MKATTLFMPAVAQQESEVIDWSDMSGASDTAEVAMVGGVYGELNAGSAVYSSDEQDTDSFGSFDFGSELDDEVVIDFSRLFADDMTDLLRQRNETIAAKNACYSW